MKHTTAFVAAGMLAIAFTSSAALAQQKLVLKASDVHPTGYPTVVAVENIGKKLEKATNGRLSVAMYPAMQLGGEKEAIEQAQVGAIAFARVSSARSARWSTISTCSICLMCSATPSTCSM